jgi:hypothetical protein
VKSNKDDFVDADAIAKAVERKNMRFVPIKTDDQLDLQAMHRVSDRLVAPRTTVIPLTLFCASTAESQSVKSSAGILRLLWESVHGGGFEQSLVCGNEES